MAVAAKQARQPEQATRPLSALKPNPLNPRTVTDEGIAELADSIRLVGLLQPLVVTPTDIIIAGHRRAAAARRAGLVDVPVVFREMTEAQQLEAMLAENLARRALNPVETARACRGLADRGVAVEAIAAGVGLGRQTVLNHLAIAELPAVLQEKIADYSMAVGMAAHLVKLRTGDQITVGLKAVREAWTVTRLADVVAASIAPARPAAVTAARSPGRPAGPSAYVAPNPRAVGARPAPAANTGLARTTTDQLNDLALTIRRAPQLVRDALVREALERLSLAVREAQGRVA